MAVALALAFVPRGLTQGEKERFGRVLRRSLAVVVVGHSRVQFQWWLALSTTLLWKDDNSFLASVGSAPVEPHCQRCLGSAARRGAFVVWWVGLLYFGGVWLLLHFHSGVGVASARMNAVVVAGGYGSGAKTTRCCLQSSSQDYRLCVECPKTCSIDKRCVSSGECIVLQ